MSSEKCMRLVTQKCSSIEMLRMRGAKTPNAPSVVRSEAGMGDEGGTTAALQSVAPSAPSGWRPVAK